MGRWSSTPISPGRRVGLRPGEMELCTPLGFASYSTVAGLRKVEYRRLGAEASSSILLPFLSATLYNAFSRGSIAA